MRKAELILPILLVLSGCKDRSLVCTQSDPNWYPAAKCSYRGSDPRIELAYITCSGRPLKGRRIYVTEVKSSDTCTKVNSNGADLLRYSNAFSDARLTPFLITDDRGEVCLTFDDHGIDSFATVGIWRAGDHVVRFSRSEPDRGPGKLERIHKLSKRDARRSAVVMVTLCNTECVSCSGQ